MKYKNKDSLKEKAVQLYLEGKTYIEIAKILNVSRNYVSNLIKDDVRVIEKSKIIKVTKGSHKFLKIGINLLNKIGITSNSDVDEYVEISVNSKENAIIVKKIQ